VPATDGATAPALTQAGEAGAAGEERRGRRRRRRGRGPDRVERDSAASPANTPASEDAGQPSGLTAIAQAGEPETATFSPAAPFEATPAAIEPATEATAAARAAATPREAPRPRPIEPAPMPVAELLPIVESSGMTLTQTDPQKLAAAQARAAEMQPPPVRAGRERPVLAPLEETPLTQVETREQP